MPAPFPWLPLMRVLLAMAGGLASVVASLLLSGRAFRAAGDAAGPLRIPVLLAAVILVPAAITVAIRRADRRSARPVLWPAFAAGAFGPVALVLFGWVAMLWWTDWRHRAAFTAAAWNAPGAVRVRLVDDLIDSRRLVGRTRAEAEALLGAPDDPEVPAWRLGGPRGPVAWEEEWLELTLGDRDTVSDARIARRAW